ncbi:MAG: prepilin-type N-terminal cleavage/methylation domain-containing protein [Verrucomicrobiae bacterium]|nr:prepilin-type N-terminal cleavage/methylation domain-containing protein [Verrucomicrobiae bacterium]
MRYKLTPFPPSPSDGLRRNKKGAFTLIELLVVVTLLAVLMGLLSPALKQARGRAQQIKCMSNLRQLGLALTSYANNYDGWIPPYSLTAHGYSYPRSTWPGLLMAEGYIPGGNGTEMRDSSYTGIMRCPSLPITATPGKNNYNYLKSYGMRGTYNSSMSPTLQFWNILNESDPAQKIWIADTASLSADPNFTNNQIHYFDGGFNLPKGHTLTLVSLIHLRHGGVANAWFLDGHVEGLTEEKAMEYARQSSGFDTGPGRIARENFSPVDF